MEDILEETKSGDGRSLHQAQLDISKGTVELNHTLEDYQYFDSDFDQLLSLSNQVRTMM